MPRTPYRIKLDTSADAPEVTCSVRLSRTKDRLVELRKHYPDAYIMGVPYSDGGLFEKTDIAAMPRYAPVDWSAE